MQTRFRVAKFPMKRQAQDRRRKRRTELARLKVNVIISSGPAIASSAGKATSVFPIVLAQEINFGADSQTATPAPLFLA